MAFFSVWQIDSYGKYKTILANVMCFVPCDRVDEKSLAEKVDYRAFIESGFVIPCGNRIIDYSVVEDYVFEIEKKFGKN